MLLYSHLSIGYQVMKNTDINLSYFYTGLVAPDVRYLQHAPREQTHINLQELQTLLINNPPKNHKEKSFNLGYSIHLVTDFIFHLFTNTLKINPVFFSLLMEQYYLRRFLVKNADFMIPAKGSLIKNLSIDPEKLQEVISFCQQHIKHRQIETAMNIIPKELQRQLNSYFKTSQKSAKFIQGLSLLLTPLLWYLNRRIVKQLGKVKS